MKTMLLLILIIPMAVNAKSPDWFMISANSIIAIDYLQTLEIAQSSEWNERNPIMGEHPSTGDVNRYFVSLAIIYNVAAQFVPKKHRNKFYVAIGLGHGSAVVHNYSAGIRIQF